MILLGTTNRALTEALSRIRTDAQKHKRVDAVDVLLLDFDGTQFHVAADKDSSVVSISISMRGYAEIQQHGLNEYLHKEYGQMIKKDAEHGYDLSLTFNAGGSEAETASAMSKIAALKTNILSVPLITHFEKQKSLPNNVPSKVAVIPYRDSEPMYISASHDRVTVIFSILFRDPDDIVLGRIFLNELQIARKKYMQAPQVLYTTRDAPTELSALLLQAQENLGYVTFVLTPRHFGNGQEKRCAEIVQMFRNYLHYHIKCSKAHLHTRMRARVASLLKVLQRAQPF